ncbi:MAG: cytoplasmic protein [Planctomycetota bacterium]
MPTREQPSLDRLNAVLDELLAGASEEQEEVWALLEAIREAMKLPMDVMVVDHPVSLVAIDTDGDLLSGITARCVDNDGHEHQFSLAAIRVTPDEPGHELINAYRHWLELDPLDEGRAAQLSRPEGELRRVRRELDLSQMIDLVLVRFSSQAAHCRLLGDDRDITLRADGLSRFVPGHVLTVRPKSQMESDERLYLSGEVASARIDAAALGLTPLELSPVGEWNPAEGEWLGRGEALEGWAEAIMARGSRQVFEMEQVVPGRNFTDPFGDPISESTELRESGDLAGAGEILQGLLEEDLRCLDAHVHLGHLDYRFRADWALPHYEVGIRIAELSLGADFDGLLPWEYTQNRPFLRSLHGCGTCLWRLERWEEAERVFERLLWLDPDDFMSNRFSLAEVQTRTAWTKP